MNKIIIVLSILLLNISSAYCQVSLSIDTLYISNVNYILTDSNKEFILTDSNNKEIIEIYSEDKEAGPYITACITFRNLSTDTLLVDSWYDFTHYHDTDWSTKHSDNGGLYLTFNYNSKIYKVTPFYIYPVDREPVLPGGKQKLKFGDWLFLGTDIFKEVYGEDKDFYGADYTKEVIECLPTLQVVFEYDNKLYRSYEIKEVKYIKE